MINDPFISVLCSTRGNFGAFCIFFNTILKTTDKKDIEILLNIDSEEDYNPYIKILQESGIDYKLLIYDNMIGYNDLHLFYTDLCQLASGNMLWILYNEIEMLTSNWVVKLKQVYDIFEDHIIICEFNAKIFNKNVIISKEWFRCRDECISPTYDIDGHLKIVGSKLKRFIHVKDVDITTVITEKSTIESCKNLLPSSRIYDTNIDYHINLIKSYMKEQLVTLPECMSYI